MKNEFLNAMNFRHACKVFDNTKKIDNKDINYILEIARKSPSSFGMEAWKFLVITNDDLKIRLKLACWNQEQITSCSHLVILLAGIHSVKIKSGEVKKRFRRRDISQETLDFYMELYQNHLKETLSSDENIYSWTSKQSYIAAANMMTAAAFIGIDSCPIEGFNKQQVETILKLDITKYQLSMILPFGYRLNHQSKQLRLPIEDITEFIY
jgi:nitroreductase